MAVPIRLAGDVQHKETCACHEHIAAAAGPAAGEYVEDTEEYINIELDSSRNRLIRLEVVLTAGTFALAIFTLVGGGWIGQRQSATQVPSACR